MQMRGSGAIATLAALALHVAASAQTGPLSLRVDATQIERSLIHSEMIVPARPGPLELHYVEWVPGNHNPSGPIWNVVDLFITDSAGRTLDWERDIHDPFLIRTEVPGGVNAVKLEFTYIANQPWVNSRSTDSYGRPGYGALNWNSVLFYPKGADKDQLQYEPTLTLPRTWNVATALPVETSRGGEHHFKPVSLARLVDSPVIFGAPEQIRTYELEAPETPTHYFHGVAPKAEQLELPQERIDTLERMLDQTRLIFGRFPHDEFHFLAVLGDDLPGFGVEHNTSTLFDMDSDEWMTASGDNASSMGVVPHEYIHVWSGKLRTPRGLHSRNFDDDNDTSLLWAYEGLTSYYDDVVSVRSGLIDDDEYTNAVTNRLARYAQQAGRRWRSVEDTARAMRHLREPRAEWVDLIRRQDYYSEGALFWMLADATIRKGTGGRKSLDDWAKAFFEKPFVDYGKPVEYDRAEIVASLSETYPSADWDALIARYIESPGSTITDDLPPLLGYTFTWVNEPSALQTKNDRGGHAALFAATIGLGVDAEGEITRILPGEPADEAGLGYAMRLIGVNGVVFSRDVLKDAIEDTPETGGIDLLVQFGEAIREYRINYDGGAKYPRLVRDERQPDVLGQIMAPK